MLKERKLSDLYEAAYLIAKKFLLKRIDRHPDSRRCYFVFDDNPECKKAVFDYWIKQGLVEPKVYAEALRYLKDILHSDDQLDFFTDVAKGPTVTGG